MRSREVCSKAYWGLPVFVTINLFQLILEHYLWFAAIWTAPQLQYRLAVIRQGLRARIFCWFSHLAVQIAIFNKYYTELSINCDFTISWKNGSIANLLHSRNKWAILINKLFLTANKTITKNENHEPFALHFSRKAINTIENMKSAQFFHSQKNKRPFLKSATVLYRKLLFLFNVKKNRVSLTMTEWVRDKTNLTRIHIQKHTINVKEVDGLSMEPLQMVTKQRKKHDESCLNLGFHHFKSRSKCDSFDQIWQIKIHWRTPRSNWWERAWKAKANVCLAWSLCLFSFFVFLVWCVYRLKSIAIARTCSIPLHHAWSLTQSLQFIWIAFHQIKYGPHDHSLPIKSTCEIHYIEWE